MLNGQIENDNIPGFLADAFQYLLAVLSFANNDVREILFDDLPQPTAYQGMIIGDKNSHV
jgi:hypothetical protein